MKKYNNASGFTLIELSIVIVIIGLIVAGVVAGQSLVRQAQLRSVLSDAENVKASVNSFLLQYSALPGDIDNASSYFSTCSLNGTDATASNECDGDGDKEISGAVDATDGQAGVEGYMAWMHLAKAGIFSGSFAPGADAPVTIGTEIPAAKLASTGMSILYSGSSNYVRFGAVDDDGAAGAEDSVMSPPEASALDAKADDGAMTTGSVIGGNGGETSSPSDCDGSGSAYDLSLTADYCTLLFAL